jgi:hypothetical protein
MNGYDPVFAERIAERKRLDDEYAQGCAFHKAGDPETGEKDRQGLIAFAVYGWQHMHHLLHRPAHRFTQDLPSDLPAD